MADDPKIKIMPLPMLESNIRNIGFENIEIKPLTEYFFILTCQKGS